VLPCTWSGGLSVTQVAINSIDYAINSSFRKVFDTKSQEVIDVCLGMFNSPLINQPRRPYSKSKFLRKFSTADNVLCRGCADNVVKEMSFLSSVSS